MRISKRPRVPRIRRTSAALLTSVVALALASAGCGDDDSSGGDAVELRAPSEEQNLEGVCPDTVVVQTDWMPEAEHGPVYQLLGPGYKINTAAKSVTGPLVVDGVDTGVKLEIRAGGAAISYQNIPSQMYLQDEIMLGMVSTDGAMRAAKDRPVTAVLALMEKSPQMLMWDPETHPDWQTIEDIGRSNEKVVYVEGSSYAPMLVADGLVKESQLDASYDGSPSRFVADPSIAQQGYATAEPYVYEHEVSAWGKPVEYQLLADVGYSVYPQALTVRSGELDEFRPCLEKLVPIMQQAIVDFATDSERTVKLIAEVVRAYDAGWVYSEDTARFGAEQMLELGILGNGPDTTVGNFDMERVEQTRQKFTPIFTETGSDLPKDLTAEDLNTNEFIDESISMP